MPQYTWLIRFVCSFLLMVSPGLLRGCLDRANAHAATSRPSWKTSAHRFLDHYNKKHTQAAWRLLHPRTRRSLTQASLKKQFALYHKAIGTIQRNHLRLLSERTLSGKTRLIWRTKSAKGEALVLFLFDQHRQIIGFAIQSPALRQMMAKETKTTPPQAKLMKQLDQMVEELLRGYNRNRLALFCRYCSPLMKRMFPPHRFAMFRQLLWARFGKYHKRHFLEARKRALHPKALIIHYRSQFSGCKRCTLRIIFQRSKQSYKIANWQIRRETGQLK